MTHPTLSRVESTVQAERTAALTSTTPSSEAMRLLQRDELLAVAGGPVVQNQDT